MRIPFILLGLALLLPASISAQDEASNNPMFVVTINNATLADNATIMGYDVRVQGGSVLVAPLLPKGWEVLVRNFVMETPPWHSTMNATCMQGAQGVGLEAFDQFLIVEEEPSLSANASFQVEVGLITTDDGEHFGITWMPDAALALRPFRIPEK